MAIIEFASVDDLVRGWRTSPLSEKERMVARTLIMRASAMLQERLDARGVDVESLTDAQLIICTAIVCDAVRYSIVTATKMQSTDILGETYDRAVWDDSIEGAGVRITDEQLSWLGLGIGRRRAGMHGVVRDDER